MRDTRGVSEILGYSLVFSLVLLSVAIVSVGGLSGFQDAQTFERQANAGKAFDVLHNNLEDVYYQGAPSRGTEIDLGETTLEFGDPVEINVTVGDDSTVVETRPLVQDLGDGGEIVYEGGAVFQTTRNGGVVRDEPPMLLREDRAHVIVPKVKYSSSRSVGGGTVLVRARSQGQDIVYENTSEELTINVTSPRSDLWYEYLTSRAVFDEGDCDLDGNEVVCQSNDDVDQIYVVRSDISMVFDR